MIVISGALVLVALVLLIIGVVGPDLTFVYASIGVSLVSLVFLVIGILQRRGETAPAAEGEGAAAATPVTVADPEGVTAVVPAQESRATSVRKAKETEPAVAETVAADPPAGGTVLVVEGRPRYHVTGCRYLSGKTAQSVDVTDARDEGFTPCGVCKPDDALAAMESTAPLAIDPVVEEPVASPVVEEDVPGVEVAPARRAARTAKAPAKKAPARPARTAAATTAATTPAAPRKTAGRAPSKAAAAAAAATPAAASASKRAGSVVVIPDRGKFHRAECRYVRGVAEAEVMSKTAASRQGYAACGVCKP